MIKDFGDGPTKPLTSPLDGIEDRRGDAGGHGGDQRGPSPPGAAGGGHGHRPVHRAGAGEVLASDAVIADLGDRIETEPLPPMQVKGFSDPVSACRVTRYTPA